MFKSRLFWSTTMFVGFFWLAVIILRPKGGELSSTHGDVGTAVRPSETLVQKPSGAYGQSGQDGTWSTNRQELELNGPELEVIVGSQGAEQPVPPNEPQREPLVILPPEGLDCCAETLPGELYEIIDGQLLTYHPNYMIASFGAWDGRHKQGPWEYYNENGQVAIRCSYVNGIAEGPGISWHSNGVEAISGESRGGKFHGTVRAWHPDGTVDSEKSGQYINGEKVR